MKKKIIIVSSILMGLAIFLFWLYLYLSSLGPMFGKSKPSFIDLGSYEEAKITLGDAYLYPQLPPWTEINEEYSVTGWYAWPSRKKYYKFTLSMRSYLNDDVNFHTYFYAIDLSKKKREYQEYKLLDRYIIQESPVYFNEVIDGVDVSYAVVPLRARAMFTIDKVDYGIRVGLLDLPEDTDVQTYGDKIWQELDFMVRSVISQKN